MNNKLNSKFTENEVKEILSDKNEKKYAMRMIQSQIKLVNSTLNFHLDEG